MVRKLCPKCKKQREFTEEERNVIETIARKYNMEINLEGKTTYEAVGCKHCNNIGYYERIGIFEILLLEDEIKELIVQNASTLEIRNAAMKHGYMPLVMDGINKVLDGQTNLKEINRKLLIF